MMVSIPAGVHRVTEQQVRHLRFHAPHSHLAHPFGGGSFGEFAERMARLFGTPKYLAAQSAFVVAWIVVNATTRLDFDPYPFILLNLAFSTQAAYAAPLILLAETRQATRDKEWSAADAEHREQLADSTLALLAQNTKLTEDVKRLSEEVRQLTMAIHSRIVPPGA